MSNETSNDTEVLAATLDVADSLPGALDLRTRSYDLLRLRPGAAVLDVGCGTGRAVAELAERAVSAVGIDMDQRMIDIAGSRWPEARFETGTAEDLPFADATLAGYRADKLLHALPGPRLAIDEARRALEPGGRIVLTGQDWDAIMVDADDAALTRTIVHARADGLPAPRAARGYHPMLLDAGFTDVTVEAHTAVCTDQRMFALATGLAESVCAAGAITRQQADTWIAEQAARVTAGRFLLAIPIFLAAATRP